MSSPLRCLDGAVSPNVIRAMRDRIDLLEEEVRQYREATEVFRPYPAEWRLTKTDSRILNALHRAKGGYISDEQLLVAIYGLEPDVEIEIIKTFISKIRKKLAGTGIEIRTSWGSGYGLNPEGVLALHRIQAEGADPAHAEGVAADRGAAAQQLAARIAELEAENAALKAAIDAASAPAEPPAPTPEPVIRKRRRDWRDFAKPQPKGRPGVRPPLLRGGVMPAELTAHLRRIA